MTEKLKSLDMLNQIATAAQRSFFASIIDSLHSQKKVERIRIEATIYEEGALVMEFSMKDLIF